MNRRQIINKVSKELTELEKKYEVALQIGCTEDLVIWFSDYEYYHRDGSRCYDSCE